MLEFSAVAALTVWEAESEGFCTGDLLRCRDAFARLVECLFGELRFLEVETCWREAFGVGEDFLHAMVSPLVARAVVLGSRMPIPELGADAVKAEGWIQVSEPRAFGEFLYGGRCGVDTDVVAPPPFRVGGGARGSRSPDQVLFPRVFGFEGLVRRRFLAGALVPAFLVLVAAFVSALGFSALRVAVFVGRAAVFAAGAAFRFRCFVAARPVAVFLFGAESVDVAVGGRIAVRVSLVPVASGFAGIRRSRFFVWVGRRCLRERSSCAASSSISVSLRESSALTSSVISVILYPPFAALP